MQTEKKLRDLIQSPLVAIPEFEAPLQRLLGKLQETVLSEAVASSQGNAGRSFAERGQQLAAAYKAMQRILTIPTLDEDSIDVRVTQSVLVHILLLLRERIRLPTTDEDVPRRYGWNAMASADLGNWLYGRSIGVVAWPTDASRDKALENLCRTHGVRLMIALGQASRFWLKWSDWQASSEKPGRKLSAILSRFPQLDAVSLQLRRGLSAQGPGSAAIAGEICIVCWSSCPEDLASLSMSQVSILEELAMLLHECGPAFPGVIASPAESMAGSLTLLSACLARSQEKSSRSSTVVKSEEHPAVSEAYRRSPEGVLLAEWTSLACQMPMVVPNATTLTVLFDTFMRRVVPSVEWTLTEPTPRVKMEPLSSEAKPKDDDKTDDDDNPKEHKSRRKTDSDKSKRHKSRRDKSKNRKRSRRKTDSDSDSEPPADDSDYPNAKRSSKHKKRRVTEDKGEKDEPKVKDEPKDGDAMDESKDDETKGKKKKKKSTSQDKDESDFDSERTESDSDAEKTEDRKRRRSAEDKITKVYEALRKSSFFEVQDVAELEKKLDADPAKYGIVLGVSKIMDAFRDLAKIKKMTHDERIDLLKIANRMGPMRKITFPVLCIRRVMARLVGEEKTQCNSDFAGQRLSWKTVWDEIKGILGDAMAYKSLNFDEACLAIDRDLGTGLSSRLCYSKISWSLISDGCSNKSVAIAPLALGRLREKDKEMFQTKWLLPASSASASVAPSSDSASVVAASSDASPVADSAPELVREMGSPHGTEPVPGIRVEFFPDSLPMGML